MTRLRILILWTLLTACAFDAAPATEADVDAGADISPDTPDATERDVPQCLPTEEVCDGLDNDCDGAVDEDECSLPGATAACVQGECVVAGCADGFLDCDEDSSNGCEAVLGSPDNCGACGHRCVNPFGTTQCVDGGCVAACDEFGIDADGDPNNGCEQRALTGPVCGTHDFGPDSVIIISDDVQVCAYDESPDTGRFVLIAGTIRVDGTINALGRGYGSGGGGGGGGGGATAEHQGRGGGGGTATGTGSPGEAGDTVGTECCGSCGGGGGAGGRGGGPAGGAAGEGGSPGRKDGEEEPCKQDGRGGGDGGAGGNGGYDSPGANLDNSTDDIVLRGSGGAGGGGGGGTQSQSWSQCECPGVGGSGGAGGGGGAAGSPGGGAVELRAAVSIHVVGRIDTRGAHAVGGRGARGGDGSAGGCDGVAGAAGGIGGSAQEDGNGNGRAGGNLAVVCGVEDRRGPGGRGGPGGSGGGGGILLSAPTVAVDGQLDARGGGDEPVNGGTIKILQCAEPVGADPMLAGRVYEACPEGG